MSEIGADFETNFWSYTPETILLDIFSYLNARDLSTVRKVCSKWNRLASDELLWKRLFYIDYHINRSIDKPSEDVLWSEEYRRLADDVPLVLTECLETHSNQVLHVTFSHDGTMFSTTSKDGTVVVWDITSYPCTAKYSQDMKKYSWKHPQFSQFNSSDTLLLVSGIHFGSPHNTSGEIAVFTVQDDFLLQCRVMNKPYDVFGCWLDEHHLLSGDLHWLAHLTSLTTLWVNKASQEAESEHVPVIAQLYRFYNAAASSVRTVMVANNKQKAEPCKEVFTQVRSCYVNTKETLTINHKPEYYERTQIANAEDTQADESSKTEGELSSATTSCTSEASSDASYHLIDSKLLIYTSGRATYVPHQLSFKYIRDVHFPRNMAPGTPIRERREARQRQKEQPEAEGPDWSNYEAVKYMFDEPDRVIDLMGHIIGMALSPDHNFLYVNVRLWPPGCSVENPLNPPPISQPTYLFVVDLGALEVVGTLARPSHFFSENEDCFFVFLDVSHHFVSSGAEDGYAYLWERHYGAVLARLPHQNVVNGVAFCPTDTRLLVTASDDFCVRVWRAKSSVRRLWLQGRGQLQGSRPHAQRPCSLCD